MVPSVCAEQVAFRYPQHDHGLSPTSLAAAPGECVVITGPSGCGKSTLARCLTGLIPHLYHGELHGAVWLDGLHTTETPLWRLAERAGMVFQNPAGQMLATSVEEELVFGLENLGLPPAAIRKRVEAVVTQFGLESLRQRAPQTLSGGEQQKVALAAIMARQPPVLVLDEPLSMLDTTAAAQLVVDLTAVALAGTTVIIGEHRTEYLKELPALQTVQLGRSTDQQINELANQQVNRAESGHGEKLAPRAPFTLTVEGVTVRLGGRPVLREISFNAQGGEFLAIVGRNGVGKTTLLRALAGLQKYEGHIAVEEGRPAFGLVFQNAELQLFNASVREELHYRLPLVDEALYTYLLAVLGLTRYEATPPLLFSEGEKKRVALAAVLLRQPRDGVLLDEPSLGQDAAHKAMLAQLARDLTAAGRLVVVTTHDLALAAQADRLLLLGPEGIVAAGPPAQLFRDPAPWARLGLWVPPWIQVPRVAD